MSIGASPAAAVSLATGSRPRSKSSRGPLGRARPLRAARPVPFLPRPAAPTAGSFTPARRDVTERRSWRPCGQSRVAAPGAASTCRFESAHRRRERDDGSRRGKKEPMNPDTERDNGPIVVGVDSSDGAKEALRFALEEAKLRQATLRVVHAWQFGYIGVSGYRRLLPGRRRRSQRAAPHRRARTRRHAVRGRAALKRHRDRTRRLSRARPRRYWSTNLATPTCSSSARAGTAALPGSCSGRSASSAPTMRPARS